MRSISSKIGESLDMIWKHFMFDYQPNILKRFNSRSNLSYTLNFLFLFKKTFNFRSTLNFVLNFLINYFQSSIKFAQVKPSAQKLTSHYFWVFDCQCTSCIFPDDKDDQPSTKKYMKKKKDFFFLSEIS